MFKELRNKIIIATMAITTVVLVAAGVFIMLSSSTMRPEPKPSLAIIYDGQELNSYIKSDREEGNNRLLVTLFMVGAVIEVAIFIIIYYLSEKIVEPVKDSYEKQKLFIANASHELKTPLATIGANIEALEVNKENEKWKNNIENEVTRANKLVLDLLRLAKMDAGNIDKAVAEEVDLSTLVSEQIEIFKPKFSGKFVFKNKLVSGAKHTLAKQDFLQVLDILLDNATKYGDKKITVTLDEGELVIANDGATVKKEDTEKIFDRFYQTDKTREGSGLGLAIAKAICEQNKWQIVCKSGNKITSFTIKYS